MRFLSLLLLLVGLVGTTACSSTETAVEKPENVEAEEQTLSQSLLAEGHQHLRAGEVDEAIAAYRASIKADEKNPWPYLALAAVLGDLQRLEAALETLNQLVEQRPNLAKGYQARARIHGLMGNRAARIQDLEAVVKALPTYSEGWVELGRVYLDEGKLVPGTEALERAVALQPSPEALYLLARTYDRLGDLRAPTRWEALLKTPRDRGSKNEEMIAMARKRLATYRIQIEKEEKKFLLEWARRLLARDDWPRESLFEVAPDRLTKPANRLLFLTLFLPKSPSIRTTGSGENLLESLQGAVLSMRSLPLFERYYRKTLNRATLVIDIQSTGRRPLSVRENAKGEPTLAPYETGIHGIVLE